LPLPDRFKRRVIEQRDRAQDRVGHGRALCRFFASLDLLACRDAEPKMYAQGMRNLILFFLLTTTLAMTACTTEPYHRAFHHPFHSHDDWERDHHR
jgi:hypothetical protein